MRVVSWAAAAWVGLGAAQAAALNADYAISLAGLQIGTASMAANVDGGGYRVDIQARLTGLAGAVTGGRGGASAAGTVNTPRPLPSSFAVTARSSNDERTVRVGLAGGNVAAVEIAPPLEERRDRVPVKAVHKRGVLDPVSALLVPVLGRGDPVDPAACNRSLPIFDGAARFDLVLSYAETRMVEKPGYRGPVVVCNVRYVPVAGHRPDGSATKFMQENRDISVWLAPVEGTRVLVPLRISVRTMVGTGVVEATRWAHETGGEASLFRRKGRARRNNSPAAPIAP